MICEGTTDNCWGRNTPHPFGDRKSLQAQVLRKLECQITQVEDSPKPGEVNEFRPSDDINLG